LSNTRLAFVGLTKNFSAVVTIDSIDKISQCCVNFTTSVELVSSCFWPLLHFPRLVCMAVP
jgi:hypothetical protein